MIELVKPPMRAAVVVSVGEQDAWGRGGLAADARACAAVGVHLAPVAARVAAGERRWPIPVEVVALQLVSVLEGLGADAVKLGALGGAAQLEPLLGVLQGCAALRVVDPGLYDQAGRARCEEGLVAKWWDRGLQQAYVLTVNAAEAQALTGRRATTAQGAKDALKALHDRGVAYPLLKAHPEAKHAVERVYDGASVIEFGGDRLDGEFEGVALSALIAAHLARGVGALEAIDAAKRGVVGALREAVEVGKAPHKLAHPLEGLYRAAGLSLASVLDDPGLASGLTPSR